MNFREEKVKIERKLKKSKFLVISPPFYINSFPAGENQLFVVILCPQASLSIDGDLSVAKLLKIVILG